MACTFWPIRSISEAQHCSRRRAEIVRVEPCAYTKNASAKQKGASAAAFDLNPRVYQRRGAPIRIYCTRIDKTGFPRTDQIAGAPVPCDRLSRPMQFALQPSVAGFFQSFASFTSLRLTSAAASHQGVNLPRLRAGVFAQAQIAGITRRMLRVEPAFHPANHQIKEPHWLKVPYRVNAHAFW